MDAEIKKAEAEQKAPPEGEQKSSSEEHKESLEKLDKTELISLLVNVNSESKGRKEKIRDLESELDSYRSKDKKAKEEDLKKKGDFEKLLSEKESRIAELEPKAKAFDDYYTSEVESIKTSLGDKWDDSFGKLPLSALKKLGQTMSSVKKVEVDDPTKASKTTDKIELTEEDKKEAEFMFPNFDTKEAHEAYRDIKIKKLKIQKEKEK